MKTRLNREIKQRNACMYIRTYLQQNLDTVPLNKTTEVTQKRFYLDQGDQMFCERFAQGVGQPTFFKLKSVTF
jgi:hypothetical protein